jgi:NitT/TauT family transport system permease protein
LTDQALPAVTPTRPATAARVGRPASRTLGILALQVAFVASLLALWELAVATGLARVVLYGQPSSIWRKFVETLLDGTLLRHSWVTFVEAALGFVIGSLAGTALGLALWLSETVSRVMRPLIVALNGVPKIALAPLIIVWFGIGIESKIASAAILTAIVALITAQSGTERVDSDLLVLMRSLGANRWTQWRKIVLPASMPWVIAGLRLNVGFALIGAVVGEYIAATEGLGYLVYYAGTMYDLSSVWLGIFALMIMALILDAVVTLFQNSVRWD